MLLTQCFTRALLLLFFFIVLFLLFLFSFVKISTFKVRCFIFLGDGIYGDVASGSQLGGERSEWLSRVYSGGTSAISPLFTE